MVGERCSALLCKARQIGGGLSQKWGEEGGLHFPPDTVHRPGEGHQEFSRGSLRLDHLPRTGDGQVAGPFAVGPQLTTSQQERKFAWSTKACMVCRGFSQLSSQRPSLLAEKGSQLQHCIRKERSHAPSP